MQSTQPKKQEIDQSEQGNVITQLKSQIQVSHISDNSILFTANDLQHMTQYSVKKYWTQDEDKKLLLLAENRNFDWGQIAQNIQGRTSNMCYNRYRRLVMKSPHKNWKKEDQQLLKDLVQKHGKKWKIISLYFPNRTSKELRQRYLNFLRDGIDKSDWKIQEELKILNLIRENGKKWKSFQKELPGRTENQIKSRFYGKLYRVYQQKAKQVFEKKQCD